MFRTVVVWIVLSLAGAPQASLLCRGWCDVQGQPMPECHGQQTAVPMRVGPAASCDGMTVTEVPFVREDVRRRAAPPHTSQAIVAVTSPLTGSIWRSHPGTIATSELMFERRPNLTALRI